MPGINCQQIYFCLNMSEGAVVLVSGGIDSATVLAYVTRKLKIPAYALIFDYGQRHRIEIKRAVQIIQDFENTRHLIISIDLKSIGGSALTDNNIKVPRNKYFHSPQAIPPTYVPSRNIIFLSLAVSWAESMEVDKVFYGANNIDYSGYPDCRRDFVNAFQRMIELGTKAGVEGHPIKIFTPLMNMEKSEIISWGMELGVDFSKTISCYQPDQDGNSCGNCDSCIIRKNGFKQAGVVDPTNYVQSK
jgi:7-cyano-7-deazaguanine synthase